MSRATTPLPWSYRKAHTHFVIEAYNGVRVADIRYSGAPDGTTSEDDAKLIVTRANAPATGEENDMSIAADAYHQIAHTIGTLEGFSVQEHVATMKALLERCSDLLHDIPESAAGGSDTARALAADVRNCLAGRIDLVDG